MWKENEPFGVLVLPSGSILLTFPHSFLRFLPPSFLSR